MDSQLGTKDSGLKRRFMRRIASRMSVMSGEGALSVFARAKELEAQGRSIIHLELGEPDFHPGQSVIDSATRALAEGKDRYCNVIGLPALREEIAAYLARTRSIDVSPDNIVVAPGCKIALFQSMMALLEPGDEVLYPDPGFPGYASITLGFGAVPVPFTLSARNNLQPGPDEPVDGRPFLHCASAELRALLKPLVGISADLCISAKRPALVVRTHARRAPSNVCIPTRLLMLIYEGVYRWKC